MDCLGGDIMKTTYWRKTLNEIKGTTCLQPSLSATCLQGDSGNLNVTSSTSEPLPHLQFPLPTGPFPHHTRGTDTPRPLSASPEVLVLLLQAGWVFPDRLASDCSASTACISLPSWIFLLCIYGHLTCSFYRLLVSLFLLCLHTLECKLPKGRRIYTFYSLLCASCLE